MRGKYEERYRKPLQNVDYRFRDFGNRGLLAEAFDVPMIYLDITHAGIQLDWEPKTLLNDGILHTWDFIGSLKLRL